MALRILIAILILAIPMELPGCGPFLPEALFFLVRGPESPVDFAAGQLGILQPTYDRVYLVTAYRHLSGVGLNPAEQKAVQPPPPLPDIAAPAPTTPPNPWLTARNQTPLIQAVHELDPYRQVQRQGYFDTYLNCNDDAFRTAASTLERLRRGTGNVADWIAAQDVVFANCSKGVTIPAPTADPQMRADRAYQIASAKFYAEQYDAAHQDFEIIAADPASPWRTIAPYLAARCLIRASKLPEADAALERIAADSALARWHAPANSLRNYVATRLHPAARMHELALALVQPDSQATIGQDLTDYRLLFDQNVKPQPADDLSDWVLSFQSGGRDALENWRVRQTLPWLVAALQSAHRSDSALPELLAAAAEIKPDSPAWLTVSYHRTRLNRLNDARTLADTLLAGKMPTSARNQFRAERMQLARTFEDFLRFATRRPVATSTYDVELVTDSKDYLDGDAVLIFNNSLPLSYLKQAAASQLLPQSVRQQLQRVVFVRTLLLSAAPPFDQVFTLLKTPGMKRDVDPGYGRNTPQLDKIDDFRDNWWCAPNVPEIHDLAFLSAADRQQVAVETEKRSIVTGPDWLTAQTIAFAQAHPEDPRVPEALALAVRSTRYGCTDSQTGDFSQRAFSMLHTRYPDSAWTKKTPYWFK